MQRITEDELMDDPDQALAYAQADFSATHGTRVQMFRSLFPALALTGPVLDLGCGSGDVLLRFARAYPAAHFLGVDGAKAMLHLGKAAIDAEPELSDRVQLQYGIIPQCELPDRRWQLVMSHSLLHQLHDPLVLWRTIASICGSGCAVFVADLRRPDSEVEARRIVQASSDREPAILQRDFFNSLCAAFEPDEVRSQLIEAGLSQLEVRAQQPFHLSVSGVL